MKMDIDGEYQCPCCGEWNSTFVDPSAGESQSFIEDCAVCCRPNRITLVLDPESGEVQVQAEFEG